MENRGLGRPLIGCEIKYRVTQISARTDPELDEHFPEMPLDGARAEKESGPDLRVGQAVAGEAGDVELLDGQLLRGLDPPPERLVAQQGEFSPGSFGERGYPHRGQHVVSGAQVLPGFVALARAPQPLAVEKVTSGHLQAKARTVQVLDRLAVGRVRRLTAQHRAEPRLDPPRPFGRRGTSALRHPL